MSGLQRKKCTQKRVSSNRAEHKTVQSRHDNTSIMWIRTKAYARTWAISTLLVSAWDEGTVLDESPRRLSELAVMGDCVEIERGASIRMHAICKIQEIASFTMYTDTLGFSTHLLRLRCWTLERKNYQDNITQWCFFHPRRTRGVKSSQWAV